MKILLISGNHRRHLYFAKNIDDAFGLAGAIIQLREHMMPKPPDDIDAHDRDNFIHHFTLRDKAEKAYFGDPPEPNCPILHFEEGALNMPKCLDFVRGIDPDVCLIFGTEMVKEPLYSALPRDTINLHLGLSPYYRGAGTFWEFYFMEPNFVGTTFHHIVAEPDAGDIVHQVRPELDLDDGLHDVACKAVVKSAEEVLQLLELYERKGGWTYHPQIKTGKLFLLKDFRPEHLRVLYDLFDGDIVRQYLEGRLKGREPDLIRQF